MQIIKRVALIGIVVCVTGFTGCVSPFYGTARIEKGWHMDAGVAATSFRGQNEWFPYCVGGRGDFEARYGFKEYLGFNCRIGLGYGIDVNSEISQGRKNSLTGDLALGVQGSYPLQYLTPALRVEALTYGFALTLLLGIGKKEWLTLGSRFYVTYEDFRFYLPSETFECFLGIHPLAHWNVFAGMRWFTPEFDYIAPYFSLGVGYKLK